MDYPRFPISEMHFGKLPESMEFQSWNVNFKTEVWSKTADRIREIEIAKSIDELMTSRSVVGRPDCSDYDMLDEMIASALKKLLDMHVCFQKKSKCRRATCSERRPILTIEANCSHDLWILSYNRSLWSGTRSIWFVQYTLTKWWCPRFRCTMDRALLYARLLQKWETLQNWSGEWQTNDTGALRCRTGGRKPTAVIWTTLSRSTSRTLLLIINDYDMRALLQWNAVTQIFNWDRWETERTTKQLQNWCWVSVKIKVGLTRVSRKVRGPSRKTRYIPKCNKDWSGWVNIGKSTSHNRLHLLPLRRGHNWAQWQDTRWEDHMARSSTERSEMMISEWGDLFVFAFFRLQEIAIPLWVTRCEDSILDQDDHQRKKSDDETRIQNRQTNASSSQLEAQFTFLKMTRQWSRWSSKEEVRWWDTCREPTELLLICCLSESTWTKKKKQIKCVDTQNQLADLLTKGHAWWMK